MENKLKHMIELMNRVDAMMKDPEKANEVRNKAKIKKIEDEILNEEIQATVANIENILNKED